jgi:hypothetical protein
MFIGDQYQNLVERPLSSNHQLLVYGINNGINITRNTNGIEAGQACISAIQLTK